MEKLADFQQHFAVYGRKGNKCSNTDCNGKIKRIVTSRIEQVFFALIVKNNKVDPNYTDIYTF